MIASGNFYFKSFKERTGGKLVTAEGKIVDYTSAYILKFDEILEDGNVCERTTKVSVDNHQLIEKLSKFDIYQSITLRFAIHFLQAKSGAWLELVDAISAEEKQSQKENA